MYIFVYNKKAIDSDRAFKKVRDEVLKPLVEADFISIPRKGVIEIGPRLIQIDFRSGETYKLSGIRSDYYIWDCYYPNDDLYRGRFGKKINSYDDIFDIVIEHIKSLMVNKESEE